MLISSQGTGIPGVLAGRAYHPALFPPGHMRRPVILTAFPETFDWPHGIGAIRAITTTVAAAADRIAMR